MKCYWIGLILSSFLLLGCANSSVKSSPTNQPSAGGLDKFNRSMFNFNYNILDAYVVRPAAVAWRDYVPQPARNGLNNFFGNLNEPATMANYLLQGNPYQAMVHFTRFFLNSTLGLGGLMDIAGMANPELAKTDPRGFGTTLAHYGVGYGPYMVLPGYGSFTPRQDLGDAADDFYPVLSYLNIWATMGKWALEGLETRAQLLDSDSFLQSSDDPYAMLRSAYFQHYDFLTRDGKLLPQDNPNADAIQGDLKDIDSQ